MLTNEWVARWSESDFSIQITVICFIWSQLVSLVIRERAPSLFWRFQISSFWPKDYVRSRIKIGSVVCLYTPVLPSVPEMDGVYATEGTLFWECTFGGVYIPCFTRMPRRVTVGDLGLRCCVPCLTSAIITLYWFYTSAVGLILFQIHTMGRGIP